jgi:hypothetical protein
LLVSTNFAAGVLKKDKYDMPDPNLRTPRIVGTHMIGEVSHKELFFPMAVCTDIDTSAFGEEIIERDLTEISLRPNA